MARRTGRAAPVGSTDGSGGSTDGTGGSTDGSGGSDGTNGGTSQDPLGGLPGLGNIPGLGTIPGLGDGSGGSGSDGTGGNGSTGSGSSTDGAGAPDDVSGIADKVDDALVMINVTFTYQGAEGAGTGIVLTSDGDRADQQPRHRRRDLDLRHRSGNGKTYSASVVGYSKTNDIAVLQLDNASGLATATIADSSKVQVGDAVVGRRQCGRHRLRHRGGWLGDQSEPDHHGVRRAVRHHRDPVRPDRDQREHPVR